MTFCRTIATGALRAWTLGACWFLLDLRAVRAWDDAPKPNPVLRAIVDEVWQFELNEDPLLAMRCGDHRHPDRLPKDSLADVGRRDIARREFLRRLLAMDRATLSRPDQVDHDILRRVLTDQIAEHEFGAHRAPITNREGFHISFPDLSKEMRLDTVQDYEHYIARLADFHRYCGDQIELLRAGVEAGWTLPSVTLRGYTETISPHVVDAPSRSLLAAPLASFPDRIPEADRERLRAAGHLAITESVVPGYRDFLAFMRDEYLPAARGSLGASALPRGREFYRHRVRKFTTLDVTPEHVHETGLVEVKRIREEMKTVIQRTGFQGTFTEFLEHLRTSPRFYAETPESLMKEVASICKRIDGQLPLLFRRLPRTPYGLREIPAYVAPRTTSAYYMPLAGDGSRAGFYYVNTYDLKSRPLFALEALSLHEAVPGHHLQIALQAELVDLPDYRRFTDFTAFVEGWALYSERLGIEIGLYRDPYSDFGRLTFEMWRACRLVVDTGIHYLGWTREQAIDFLAGHTALAMHDIVSEVDRYIAWPGQALAYKMGELQIRELRAEAERQLGPRFDVREFHDVVLNGGAVPLDVLADNVRGYLRQKAR